MAASVTLYTFGNMVGADIDSATSEATGYPKENLMDNNPDTYWKGTSTAAQTIDIDLNSTALTVYNVFMFVRNYASLVDSEDLTVSWSDNDSDYTALTGASDINGLSNPNFIRTTGLTEGLTHRYWRFLFDNLTTVPEVSMLALGCTYTISQGNQWPEDDTDVFYNRKFNSSDGRDLVVGVNSRSFKEFSRTYLINGTTNWNYLRNAHQDSRGSLLPLVLLEGTADQDERLVRFVDDKLNQNQRDYQLYKPTVRFKEIPYYPDGEAY